MRMLGWFILIANAAFALMYLNLIAHGSQGYEIYFLLNLIAFGVTLSALKTEKKIRDGEIDE